MLLDAISTYLAAAGIGLTEGTNLFKSDMPDTPDLSVAIYEWGGQHNEKVFIPGPGTAILERPSFQILVRGNRANVVSGVYAAARALAEAIYLKLDGYKGTLSGVEYKWIECAGNPYSIKTDENQRPHIGADYDVVKALG
jgi:hypothetical protein